MISLKHYLDKLAGPDHPFCKGAPVEGLDVKAEKLEGSTETIVPIENNVQLNKFLRTNTN